MDTAPYTCNSCLVAFRTSEAQRGHMRSDWHRYNLKRRVTSLPPISSETFTEKVQSAQANTSAAAAKATFERSCDSCRKVYSSENAYQAHLKSKKHQLRILAGSNKGSSKGELTASSTGSPAMAAEGSTQERKGSEAEIEFEKLTGSMKETSLSDSGAPKHPRPENSTTENESDHPQSPENSSSKSDLPLSRCLFCNYDSPTLKLSICHMEKFHGLFIPEQSYLVDLEGLISYLQAKIHQNYECLLCHKLKGTAAGVQTHMRDKGHCMVGFESEEEMIEIGQFYDFSSTYSDDESEELESDGEADGRSGGVKLPTGKTEEEDDGWETGSSLSSIDSAEITSVPMDVHMHQRGRLPLHRHHSHTDPRPHRNVDGFHSHAHHGTTAVFYDESELHLPSGRSVGHRNFRKYFRQNLTNYLSPTERAEHEQKLLTEKVGKSADDESEDEDEAAPVSRGRQALTRRSDLGMTGVTVSQKKDAAAAELRDRRQAQKLQNKYRARVEKQNNSQQYFRDPLLQ